MNRFVLIQLALGAAAISMMFVGDPRVCGIAYIVANAGAHTYRAWGARP